MYFNVLARSFPSAGSLRYSPREGILDLWKRELYRERNKNMKKSVQEDTAGAGGANNMWSSAVRVKDHVFLTNQI